MFHMLRHYPIQEKESLYETGFFWHKGAISAEGGVKTGLTERFSMNGSEPLPKGLYFAGRLHSESRRNPAISRMSKMRLVPCNSTW